MTTPPSAISVQYWRHSSYGGIVCRVTPAVARRRYPTPIPADTRYPGFQDTPLINQAYEHPRLPHCALWVLGAIGDGWITVDTIAVMMSIMALAGQKDEGLNHLVNCSPWHHMIIKQIMTRAAIRRALRWWRKHGHIVIPARTTWRVAGDDEHLYRVERALYAQYGASLATIVEDMCTKQSQSKTWQPAWWVDPDVETVDPTIRAMLETWLTSDHQLSSGECNNGHP